MLVIVWSCIRIYIHNVHNIYMYHIHVSIYIDVCIYSYSYIVIMCFLFPLHYVINFLRPIFYLSFCLSLVSAGTHLTVDLLMFCVWGPPTFYKSETFSHLSSLPFCVLQTAGRTGRTAGSTLDRLVPCGLWQKKLSGFSFLFGLLSSFSQKFGSWIRSEICFRFSMIDF